MNTLWEIKEMMMMQFDEDVHLFLGFLIMTFISEEEKHNKNNNMREAKL